MGDTLEKLWFFYALQLGQDCFGELEVRKVSEPCSFSHQ